MFAFICILFVVLLDDAFVPACLGLFRVLCCFVMIWLVMMSLFVYLVGLLAMILYGDLIVCLLFGFDWLSFGGWFYVVGV